MVVEVVVVNTSVNVERVKELEEFSIIFRSKFIHLCNIQGHDHKQCLLNSVNVKGVKELKEFGFHININFLKF